VGATRVPLEAGAVVNLADFLGGSALAQACGKGQEGVIRALFEPLNPLKDALQLLSNRHM